MRIEAFILVNNEERLMPYIMRHYSQFADVILLESNSTDKTKEIGHSLGATIWSYQMPDELDDQVFVEIKNNCWKNSKADWVIIADADEFIYHRDIINMLKDTDATVFIPTFYDMYSEKFPTTEGQIYEEVRNGTRGDVWDRGVALQRINLFKPNELTEINYGIGCHTSNPQGNVKIGNVTGLLTLHMKYLSREYVIERHKRNSKRLSSVNRQHGWGLHSDWSAEFINKKFDDNIPNLIKVL